MTIGDPPHVTAVANPAVAQDLARSKALRRELERLRDDVIRHRTRVSPRTTIDKCELLTLLAEAADEGQRQVSVADLANQLKARKALPQAPSLNTVRKALIDLSDMIDEAYLERPAAHHRARIESSGTIALLPSDQKTSETAFRTLLRSLPGIARELLPWGQLPIRDKWRYIDTPSRESSAAGTQYEWLSRVLDADLVRNVSDPDLRILRDLLYEMTSSSLAGVIHNLDPEISIVAIEHHPTHEIDKWDDELTWLNLAYHDYIERGGKVTRVVYFEPDRQDVTIDDQGWWERWCDHIEVRARRETIAVVTGEPEPGWVRALDGDYLVLVGRLVIRYEQIDFPRSFEGLPAEAHAATRVNLAASRLATMPHADSRSLTWLTEVTSIRDRLEEVRDKVRAAKSAR